MLKKLGIKAANAIIILSLFSGLIINASAAITASDYLDNYAVSVSAGANHSVIINFDVNATRIMNLVGASNIVVQVNNNGVWTGVATYFGSTSNGMLAANTFSYTGSKTYTGNAGMQYRAIVTVYAGNSTGEDSRTVTTNAVTAT
jgi:hypothetical protein